MEVQTILPLCQHKKKKNKNTEDLHRNCRQMAETTAKLTMLCVLKDGKREIKRKSSEVRCTEARGFSEREHKVTPRSPRHTGFDAPTALS